MTYTANTSNLCDTKYYIKNSNKGYELVKVGSVSDLGVRFDSDNMHEKVNKACSTSGIIKINFIYLHEDSFVLLYKAMVRPHLEYANSVWLPYKKEILKLLKRYKK